MLVRLAPLVLVMLAACDQGDGTAQLPAAATPGELVRAALKSPGDGSDILDALATFEATETWRNAPAGLVVSDFGVEAILNAESGSARAEAGASIHCPEELHALGDKTASQAIATK